MQKARQLHFLKGRFAARATFDSNYHKKHYPKKVIPRNENDSLRMQLANRNTGSFKRGGKKYFPGFVYKHNIDTNFHVIDPLQDNMTSLKIECLDTEGRRIKSTILRFKKVVITRHFSKLLNENAEFMIKHGGGVSRKLPSGKMSVAGANDKKVQGYQFKATRKEQRKLLHHMRRFLIKNGFRHVVERIRKKTELRSVPREWGPKTRRRKQDTQNLWTAFLVISKNLGNESHTDLDFSKSVAIWHELDPTKQSGNWYFLLPHVQLQRKDKTGYIRKPVAIRLSHGTVMEWDGRLLRHCTSITSTTKGGAAYSTFVCANERSNSRHEAIKSNDYVSST
jgi:hypothetical protein